MLASVLNETQETWEGLNMSAVAQNRTNIYYVFEIGLPSQIVNGIISILTIFFNLILIVCMRTHRQRISEVVRYQLTSLGTSDLISGISPGIWCLCLIPSLNENARVCAFMHFIFSTSQYATLLNLCHLSARRWKVLNRSTQPMVRSRFRIPLVFLLTSLAWFISLILHLPSIVSFTKKLKVNGCVSTELFEKPEAVAYLVPMYGLTLLALDIFYLHSLVILKKIRLRVLPRPQVSIQRTIISTHGRSHLRKLPWHRNAVVPEVPKPGNSSSVLEVPQHSSSLKSESRLGNSFKPEMKRSKRSAEPDGMKSNTEKQHMSLRTKIPKLRNLSTTKLGQSKNSFLRQVRQDMNQAESKLRTGLDLKTEQNKISPASDTSCFKLSAHTAPLPGTSLRYGYDQSGCSTGKTQRNSVDLGAGSQFVRSGISQGLNGHRLNLQHKAFKQLLAALIIINLATLPYMGMTFGFVLGTITFDPENVWVVDMQVLSLNSLINPLIYGIYLKEVRNAVKENVAKILHLAAAFFRTQ